MNPKGLDKSRLPAHVAIIMDGNGRWARFKGKSRIEGHRRGKISVRSIVETSRKLGIKFLSLYTFSVENWQRPRAEVGALMSLLRGYLSGEKKRMMQHSIRLMAIGDRTRLPGSVRRVLEQTIEMTRYNQGMTVVLALSYSGRNDILKMVRKIARKVKQGSCKIDDIDEQMISANTETNGIPDPDLLIRTSGEMRMSNFFLWQIPYTELYITPTLWPDFHGEHYIQALMEYQQRQRRFGKTDEMVA